MSPLVELRLGVDEHHRSAAAALYYDAFSQLLRPILGERAQALALLGPALDLERAVAAIEVRAAGDEGDDRHDAISRDHSSTGDIPRKSTSPESPESPGSRKRITAEQSSPDNRDLRDLDGERLVGICGLHFDGRHFVALRVGPMLRAFGLVDGLRRILVGALLDHQPRAGELVIDGIAVLPTARERGIGSLLLGELERFARAERLRALTLDVAADNTRAADLYRRCGFVERGSSSSWLVRRAYGITAVQRMSKRLA